MKSGNMSEVIYCGHDSNRKADGYCPQLDIPLSTFSFEKLKELPSMRNLTLVPLHKIEEFKNIDPETNQPISIYSLTSERPISMESYLVGNSRGHQVLSLQDAFKLNKEQLQQSLDTLRNHMCELRVAKNHCDKLSILVQSQSSSAKDQVKSYFDSLRQFLHSYEQTQLQGIDDNSRLYLGEIENVGKGLLRGLQCFDAFEGEFLELLTSNSVIPVLQTKPQLTRKLFNFQEEFNFQINGYVQNMQHHITGPIRFIHIDSIQQVISRSSYLDYANRDCEEFRDIKREIEILESILIEKPKESLHPSQTDTELEQLKSPVSQSIPTEHLSDIDRIMERFQISSQNSEALSKEALESSIWNTIDTLSPSNDFPGLRKAPPNTTPSPVYESLRGPGLRASVDSHSGKESQGRKMGTQLFSGGREEEKRARGDRADKEMRILVGETPSPLVDMEVGKGRERDANAQLQSSSMSSFLGHNQSSPKGSSGTTHPPFGSGQVYYSAPLGQTRVHEGEVKTGATVGSSTRVPVEGSVASSNAVGSGAPVWERERQEKGGRVDGEQASLDERLQRIFNRRSQDLGTTVVQNKSQVIPQGRNTDYDTMSESSHVSVVSFNPSSQHLH